MSVDISRLRVRASRRVAIAVSFGLFLSFVVEVCLFWLRLVCLGVFRQKRTQEMGDKAAIGRSALAYLG